MNETISNELKSIRNALLDIFIEIDDRKLSDDALELATRIDNIIKGLKS